MTIEGLSEVNVTRELEHSRSLFERAKCVLVDGVSSPSRGPANFSPHPLFMAEGRGTKIVDADRNSYIDLMLGYGSLIHGHAHPELVESLQKAAGKGALFATAAAIEVEVAEQITEMVECAELVSFASTGTEAAMSALRLARGFTGRPKFIKFEGHYHGWSDAYSVSSNPLPSRAFGYRRNPIPVPDSSGITQGALEDTIVLPWNDFELVEDVLKRRAGEIAAVVTEPVMANMGVIAPKPGFLEHLRVITERYGVLLYIDETVTGFRLAPGGAQQRYGVVADISSFGKSLGAGLPVSAVVGRRDIMAAFKRGQVLHYGTQNANPLLLSVVRTSLDLLRADDGAAFQRLDQLAEQLVAGVRAAIERHGIAAIVQNVGSMIQIFFLQRGSEDVRGIEDAREYGDHVDPQALNTFAHLMFDSGVFMSPVASLHSVLSTVSTTADVADIVSAADRSLEQMSAR